MNHYTTIKRKADLAAQLGLTERQVSHVRQRKNVQITTRDDRWTWPQLFADKDLVSKPTGEGEETAKKAAGTIKRAADESAGRGGGGGCGGRGLNGGGGGWRNDGLCRQRNGDGWDAGRTPRRADAGQRQHHLRTTFGNVDVVDVSTHVCTFAHISVHVAAYATRVAAHDTAYAIPGPL